jgi:hypothetical protein
VDTPRRAGPSSTEADHRGVDAPGEGLRALGLGFGRSDPGAGIEADHLGDLELLTSEALELIAEDLEGAPGAIVTDAEALPRSSATAGARGRSSEGPSAIGERTRISAIFFTPFLRGRTIRSIESARLIQRRIRSSSSSASAVDPSGIIEPSPAARSPVSFAIRKLSSAAPGFTRTKPAPRALGLSGSTSTSAARDSPAASESPPARFAEEWQAPLVQWRSNTVS